MHTVQTVTACKSVAFLAAYALLELLLPFVGLDFCSQTMSMNEFTNQ